jgi:pilus assembly protein Flp/PilA
MLKYPVAFLRDDEGLTMVEYAVAGSLITLAAVTAFTTLGTNVAAKITQIASHL